jgi:RHS repeat-associated protein
VTSTVGGATTSLLWDANYALPQLALERDPSAGLIRRYAYGDGRISMTTPATTAYYSTDTLGTTTELSGSGGALLGQYDSNPFGDGATGTGVDPSVAGNPFAFAGEYQDPTTSLYNLRARQYDTATGRFLSPDPLGPQDAASTYTYVANNPLGYTDPSGMKRGHPCGRSVTCWAKDGLPLANPFGHENPVALITYAATNSVGIGLVVGAGFIGRACLNAKAIGFDRIIQGPHCVALAVQTAALGAAMVAASADAEAHSYRP